MFDEPFDPKDCILVVSILDMFTMMNLYIPHLTLLRLNGEKLRDSNPRLPLDAERNTESAEAEPVDTTDFAEGHGYSPLNEF